MDVVVVAVIAIVVTLCFFNIVGEIAESSTDPAQQARDDLRAIGDAGSDAAQRIREGSEREMARIVREYGGDQ